MRSANNGDCCWRLCRLSLKEFVNAFVGRSDARSLLPGGQQPFFLIVRQKIDRVERESWASIRRRRCDHFKQSFQVSTEALARLRIKDATVVLQRQRQLSFG